MRLPLLLTFLVLCAPGIVAAQSIPTGGGSTGSSEDQKIEDNWLDLWRKMRQQNDSSQMEGAKASAAQTDGAIANDIAQRVGTVQTQNAQQLSATPALCGVSSAVLGIAAGEAEAEVNRDALVTATAPQADATDRGDASRSCRHVGSLNSPALKKACEAAGHEVLDTATTTDTTSQKPGTLNIADGADSDAEKATVEHVKLIQGDQQFSGLGIAAKDPTRFAAVMDVRSSMATDSVIQNSLTRNMAARMQGGAQGTAVTKARLKSLGYDDSKIAALIGTNPSYATQLEAGTKLPYQDPNFYIGLQGMNETQLRAMNVAEEAQSLAQWREIYTSITAREMMLAQILEAKLRAKQPEIAAQLSSTKR